jgi:uncharacterized membrane protein
MKYYPRLFTTTSILLAVGIGFLLIAVFVPISIIDAPEIIGTFINIDSFFTVWIFYAALRFLFFKRIMKEAEINDEIEREGRLFNLKAEGFMMVVVAGFVLMILTFILLFNCVNLHITGTKLAAFCVGTFLNGMVFLFSGVLSKQIIKRNALSEEDWTIRQMSVKMLFVLLALLMQFGAALWVK